MILIPVDAGTIFVLALILVAAGLLVGLEIHSRRNAQKRRESAPAEAVGALAPAPPPPEGPRRSRRRRRP